ncbi:MAG: hypothetical protein H6620_11245 [Halobacteriovoraceae bacterium]|nr:hypothetical protein [Halobacteriovoraceae bacterium]
MAVFRFLLLFCLPAFLVSPIPALTLQSENSHYKESQKTVFEVPRDKSGRVNPWMLFQPENLSIERYFAFIDLTENVSFLETLSEEEFDIVVDFVTHMVQEGIPESLEDYRDFCSTEIDQLIEDLYGEPRWRFAYSQEGDLQIIPALSFQKPETLLCKNWFKRKAHHFGHWCGKHKKKIVAGAVVVTVVVVAALTHGGGNSSSVPVGGGMTDENKHNSSPEPINKPGEVFVDNGTNNAPQVEPSSNHTESSSAGSSEPTPLERAQILTSGQIEAAKWEIAEAANDMPSPSEKTALEKTKEVTKTVVSNIVHDVYESISKIGTTWHEINSNSSPEDQQAYKDYVATQHAKIDEIFGTYRPDYSLESQEVSEAFKAAVMEELGRYPEMEIGELPPPGALIGAVSKAATVASRTLGIAARSGSVIGSAAAVGSMINWKSPIPMTQVNDTIGWKVGDPINNRTIKGTVPTYSAVRHRHWRNEALNVKNGVITRALECKIYEPTEENIKRMEKGLAPQVEHPRTGKMVSVELHHIPPQREGGLFDFIEVTPWEHAEIDPHRNEGLR